MHHPLALRFQARCLSCLFAVVFGCDKKSSKIQAGWISVCSLLSKSEFERKATRWALALLYWRSGDRVRRNMHEEKRAVYDEQTVSGQATQSMAGYGDGVGRANLLRRIQLVGRGIADAAPDLFPVNPDPIRRRDTQPHPIALNGDHRDGHVQARHHNCFTALATENEHERPSLLAVAGDVGENRECHDLVRTRPWHPHLLTAPYLIRRHFLRIAYEQLAVGDYRVVPGFAFDGLEAAALDVPLGLGIDQRDLAGFGLH